jgi:alkyldihydroxyacetonephosphate synthase
MDAVRAIAQSGLQPSNCRLLDDREALINAISTDGSVLLLAFESADHELTAWMDRAIKLAVRAGGKLSERKDAASSSWRSSFLRGPLIQSALVSLGLVCDTFETACTWDRMRAFRSEVIGSVREAIAASGARGEVTMRFTHAYADGAAPYFTFVCTAGNDRIATWTAIKRAASDAVLRAGGTITHHHAVGRLHRPWYEKERPEPFGAALRAVKATLDPRGVMNPGVLQ